MNRWYSTIVVVMVSAYHLALSQLYAEGLLSSTLHMISGRRRVLYLSLTNVHTLVVSNMCGSAESNKDSSLGLSKDL